MSRMSSSSPLADAIERLYVVFARYPRPATDAPSPHAGISAADVARLREAPLRELGAAALARYARSAMSTWGAPAQFKHFLPRILELVATRPGPIDVPLALEKLAAATWKSWPDDERAVVSAYLSALWSHALSTGPDQFGAADVLCGIGLAGGEVEACIEQWRHDGGLAATRQLARLVALHRREIEASGTLGAGWLPPDSALVLSFLAEPRTRTRLEAAFLDHPDGADGRELAAAADVLARSFGAQTPVREQ